MSASPALTVSAVLFVALAGCIGGGQEAPSVADGAQLAARTNCSGTFSDGVEVHCEQGAQIVSAGQSVPVGWVPSSGPFGEHGTMFYRTVDPSDSPGTFRLGVYYDIQRGGIGEHISLDPINGIAWYEAWPEPVSWESGMTAFVEFPYPIESSGEMEFGLFHPHAVAESSDHFNVTIDTPALHDKPVEPLWGLVDGEIRVVHRVHGDGGPYYFHNGQADTDELGYSISQTGADYSIISRLIALQTIGFGVPP